MQCRRRPADPDRYKWIALSNATLAVLLATLDGSITIIAMPDIFRGIELDPLVPSNSFYLLWMILGYLVVTSVLIVSLGRLGDMVGRVRIYNLGFVIYTVASLLLAICWLTGRAGATVPDRLPHRPRRRRRLPARQLGRDHHRRVPREPTRDGARDQQHRRRQRLLHRADDRRRAGADRLETRLPDLGPDRAVRHRLGLPQPARAEHAESGADRLARQHHVRARADPDHGRRHLWHPALRRTRDRLEQPARAGAARRLARQLRRVRGCRAPLARPDVPPAALPDPRVHVRDAVDVSRLRRARRADVHPDHLAAGHLAPPARLQLHRDAAVRGPLHGPVHGRHAARRPDLGYPLRPLRGAAVRDRRDGADGALLRTAGGCCRRTSPTGSSRRSCS